MAKQPVRNTDATLEWMKELDLPLTRENYLDVAYLGDPPDEDEQDAEFEKSLPKEIRKSPDESAEGEGETTS